MKKEEFLEKMAYQTKILFILNQKDIKNLKLKA